MTRFLITLKQGAEFVLNCISRMVGGELFIPKIPTCTVADIAYVIAPECEWKDIGLRPGEKMHEVLIPQDEARNVLEFEDHFIIKQFRLFGATRLAYMVVVHAQMISSMPAIKTAFGFPKMNSGFY